jgi:hypothetical protein
MYLLLIQLSQLALKSFYKEVPHHNKTNLSVDPRPLYIHFTSGCTQVALKSFIMITEA